MLATRLIALLGAVCVAAFVCLCWVGGLLVAGVALLLLAAIRSDNYRKGTRR